MSLNIVKLCVGADSVADLETWQRERLRANRRINGKAEIWHTTRMVPRRQKDVLDGGSLYWVIKGLILVRQPITGFREGEKEDGTPCCLIMLAPRLIPVRPTPRRPFQGWRYLEPADAPPDVVRAGADDLARMPEAMRRELASLGLI